MSGKVFADTSILIYAHDLDAGQRNTLLFGYEIKSRLKEIVTEFAIQIL